MLFTNISIGQKHIKGFTYYSNSVSNGFYVKNTEVTIEEYLEFVDWVVDSISRRVLGKEFPSAFLIPTYNEKLEIMSEELWNINWDVKLKWDDVDYYPILINELAIPENQRFYKKRTFDYRKIIFKNSKGENINIIPYSYLISISSREKATVSYRGKRTLKLLKTGEKETQSNDFITDDRFLAENTSSSNTHDLDNKKPMTNISYNQAQAYCEWKTNQLNKKSKKVSYSCKIPNLNEYKKVWNINQEHYNFIETSPSSFSQKIEDINNYNYLSYMDYYDKYVYLRDSLNQFKHTVNKNHHHTVNLSGVLDGVHIQENKDKELDLTEQNTIKYYSYFKNTHDYFSYESNKSLVGLDNNLSEWIDNELENEDKKNFIFYYKDIEIMPIDTTNSKLVVGGNWWNGKNKNGKTFISKDKELETIGFRYVVYIQEKPND